MTVATAVCNSFKKERQQALHDLVGHTLKAALIKAAPTGIYGSATTNYSDLTGNADEVTGAGYTIGGVALAGNALTISGDICIFDCNDLVWGPGASFSARGLLIYNTSAGNRSVMVVDFGETKTVVAGTMTVILPLATASLGFLRSA